MHSLGIGFDIVARHSSKNCNVSAFVQLLKAWGAFVTTTCATDAVELVTGLGADHVIDYSAADMKEQLESLRRYDSLLHQLVLLINFIFLSRCPVRVKF